MLIHRRRELGLDVSFRKKQSEVDSSILNSTRDHYSLYKAIHVTIIVLTKPPDVNLPYLRTFLLI